MAKVKVRNIFLNEAENYSAVGTVTDDDPASANYGEPIDISGWTLLADIKAKESDKVKVGSFTFAFVTDGTDGKYVRSISSTAIAALNIKNGVWDQFYVENSVPTRLMKGDIEVDKNITVIP